jgi:hypothetical protein
VVKFVRLGFRFWARLLWKRNADLGGVSGLGLADLAIGSVIRCLVCACLTSVSSVLGVVPLVEG